MIVQRDKRAKVMLDQDVRDLLESLNMKDLLDSIEKDLEKETPFVEEEIKEPIRIAKEFPVHAFQPTTVSQTAKVKKYMAFSSIGLSICLFGMALSYSSFSQKNELQSTVQQVVEPTANVEEREFEDVVATIEKNQETIVQASSDELQEDDFTFERVPEFFEEDEEPEVVLVPCSDDETSSQFSTIQLALLTLQENRRNNLQEATSNIQKCLEEHAKKPQLNFEEDLVNLVNRYQSLDECYTKELLNFIDASLLELKESEEQKQQFYALLEEMNLQKVDEHLKLHKKSEQLRYQVQEFLANIDRALNFRELLTAVQKSKEALVRIQENAILANMLHIDDIANEICVKGSEKLDLFLFDPKCHLELSCFGKDNRVLLDLIAYFLDLEPSNKVRCVNQFELLSHMNLLEIEKPILNARMEEHSENNTTSLEKTLSMSPYLPRLVRFPSIIQ